MYKHTVSVIIYTIVSISTIRAAVMLGKSPECEGHRGEKIQLKDRCGQILCGPEPLIFPDGFTLHSYDETQTCGIVGAPEGCEIEMKNQHADYPDCCRPTIVCPEPEHHVEIVEDIELTTKPPKYVVKTNIKSQQLKDFEKFKLPAYKDELPPPVEMEIVDEY